MHARKRRDLRLPWSPLSADASGLAIRGRISVPIRITRIKADLDVATCAPTGISADSPGGSCRACCTTGIAPRPMARCFMASPPRRGASCVSSSVGRRLGPTGHSAGLRERSEYGDQLIGGGRGAAARLFRVFSARVALHIRPNSTNSTPCLVR